MSTKNWSNEQTAIFNWFKAGKGSLIVQARAGTGKTTTILEAFGHAPEAKILYTVFNKKNQLEAQSKISDARVTVKTLHGVGFGYILPMWPGVRPDGLVERDRVCQGVDHPSEVVTQVCRLVSFAKNLTVNPTVEDLVNIALEREIDAGEEWEEAGYTVGKLAEMALKALEASKVRDPQNRISFDDMVWLPVVMNWVRPRFDLVVVDEGQDMNILQLTIATKAVRPNGRICIIGDDRQAIYTFRGAAQNGLGLMKEKLGAASLGLTTTYRCPKAVVALAAEIVPDYHAAPTAPEGRVEYRHEDELLSLVRPGDAVLSRINAPLMSYCLQLLRQGVPARIEGRDIGQALLSIVKKLKARSVPDFMLKINAWGDRKVKRLLAAGKEAAVAGIQDQVETLVAVAEGASGVKEIETRLSSLFKDSESGERPCVVLSSVHKAKGLEWNNVLLLKSTFRRGTAGEEANVYYVAITRAKQTLTLLSK